MSEDALFGDDGLRVALAPDETEKVTAGERMRRRQQARISMGCHPLSMYGVCIPLHPDAPRNAYQGDGRDFPRCGSCAHRRYVGGHARDFPKCLLGYEERDLTDAEIAANRGTWREGATRRVTYGPRYSMSEASDVRAWWPACVDYQAAEVDRG